MTNLNARDIHLLREGYFTFYTGMYLAPYVYESHNVPFDHPSRHTPLNPMLLYYTILYYTMLTVTSISIK